MCETGRRRDHSMVRGDHSVKNTGCTVAATRMPLLTVARVYASRTLGLDRHRFRTEPTRNIDVELCGAIPTLFVRPVNVLRSTRAVPDQVQIQIARLSGPRQLRTCFVLDSCAVQCSVAVERQICECVARILWRLRTVQWGQKWGALVSGSESLTNWCELHLVEAAGQCWCLPDQEVRKVSIALNFHAEAAKPFQAKAFRVDHAAGIALRFNPLASLIQLALVVKLLERYLHA